MKKISYLLVLAFVVLATAVADAQVRFTKKKKYWSVGGSLNAMNYFGELAPGPSFPSFAIIRTRPNIGACIIRRFHPRASWRAQMFWGRITGNDNDADMVGYDQGRWIRNLSFRNDIKELSFTGIYDMFENRGTFQKRPDYTPYAFGGLAIIYTNPRTLYQGSWVALQPLKTEGRSYSRLQVVVPMGVGFRYKLAQQWDLAFEIGWRWTFTDYLDDVSSNYVSKEQIYAQSGELAVALSDRSIERANIADANSDYQISTIQSSVDGRNYQYVTNKYGDIISWGREGQQRGDNRKRSGFQKDWYLVTGFHLTYILYGGVKCPKFR